MERGKRKIVVLGGGFAGIECTRQLEVLFKDESNIEIVLISEDNFLLFTPLLPQVASGMIETRHVVMPIRTIIKNATFFEGRIRSIDPYGKIVSLYGTVEKRGVSIHYDYLILALGSQTNFFGMNDVKENAYEMKTLNDAVVLRNRIIDMLEQSENENNPILKKSLLTFVVVGGGFAGIETAGELMDLLVDVRKFYPHIDKDDIKVVVLEALPSILPGFAPKLAKFAHEKLLERGIDIRLKTAVTEFDGTEVMMKKLDDSKEDAKMDSIRTNTLIWTAGVMPANTIQRSIFKKERGLVIINKFLEIPEFPGTYAIGDCALFLNPKTEKPFPPTAQLAEAQAKVAAKNLYAAIKNQEKEEFEFESKGQMAVIGKRTGIASLFGSSISGFWAWVLWMNVYLSKIPRWDKRFRVLIDWTVDLFFDRDISRMKIMKKPLKKEFQPLDEVDEVW